MRYRQDNGSIGIFILCIVLVIALVVTSVAFLGRTQHTAQVVEQSGTSQANLHGFSLSPLTYNAAGFRDFLDRLAGLHAVLEWQGDWDELDHPNTGASLVIQNATTYGYTPVLVVSAFKDSSKSTSIPIRPLNSAQIRSYIGKAKGYAAAYHPLYFGVGVEVNRIYETSPHAYDEFVDLFNQTAAAVHAASPQTKVFTTFQLERLRGLRGGLFGGINDTSQNSWRLLADFKHADVLAFTSYPGIIYKKPADIPADYYQEITRHTAKPLAFTELGWPAADEAAGWPSTPNDQAAFGRTFNADIKALPVRLTVWSFMYDQQTSTPFDHLGLLDNDGAKRPAWDAFWQ